MQWQEDWLPFLVDLLEITVKEHKNQGVCLFVFVFNNNNESSKDDFRALQLIYI